MLETEQEVTDLFNQAKEEANLERNGKLNFSQTHVDLIGDVELFDQIIHDNAAPVWYLEFSYPEGEEKIYPITIHTADFRNEEEVKNFLVQELRRQIGMR